MHTKLRFFLVLLFLFGLDIFGYMYIYICGTDKRPGCNGFEHTGFQDRFFGLLELCGRESNIDGIYIYIFISRSCLEWNIGRIELFLQEFARRVDGGRSVRRVVGGVCLKGERIGRTQRDESEEGVCERSR